MDQCVDNTMFELAKSLHCRRSPPALKVLCFDFIINKWETWIAVCEKLQTNLFDNISPPLRNDLLAHLSASKSWDWKQREFLYLLLNTESKILDLEKWKLCANRDNIKEVALFLEQLVLKAPNLEHLSFRNTAVCVNDGNVWTKRHLLKTLNQLKNLQHLSLYGFYKLDEDDLKLVTENLTNLVCLKVPLTKYVGLTGFQHFFGLEKLEEFHFSIWYLHSRDDEMPMRIRHNTEWIYSWCAQCFPQLKLIAGPIEDCQMYEEEEPLECSALPFVAPKFRGPSKLETLHTKGSLPEASLPNLEKLLFFGALDDDSNLFTKISSFLNLSHLGFKTISFGDIEKILELIGNQLSHLYFDLSQFDDDVDHYKIFFLCPNLVEIVQQKLDYAAQPVLFDSKFQSLVTKHNFRHIEKVELCFDQCEKLPEGLFGLIVQAPFIKIIHLHDFNFRQEECQLAHEVVEGRFLKLEKLLFSGLDLEVGCTLEDVGLMVKNFVCGAPSLKSITVDWISLEDQWKVEQAEAIKFIDLVHDKR